MTLQQLETAGLLGVERQFWFTIGEVARRTGLPVRTILPVVDAMRGEEPDTPELRKAIADRFALGTDRRVERYWRLLGIMKGWPPFPAMTPAFEWTIGALRAHPNRAG